MFSKVSLVTKDFFSNHFWAGHMKTQSPNDRPSDTCHIINVCAPPPMCSV